MKGPILSGPGKAILYPSILESFHTQIFVSPLLLPSYPSLVTSPARFRVQGWGWDPAGSSIAGPRGKVGGGKPARRRLRARGGEAGGGGGGRLGKGGRGGDDGHGGGAAPGEVGGAPRRARKGLGRGL